MIMNDALGSPSYAEIQGVEPALAGRVVDFGPDAGAEALAALGLNRNQKPASPH